MERTLYTQALLFNIFPFSMLLGYGLDGSKAQDVAIVSYLVIFYLPNPIKFQSELYHSQIAFLNTRCWWPGDGWLRIRGLFIILLGQYIVSSPARFDTVNWDHPPLSRGHQYWGVANRPRSLCV